MPKFNTQITADGSLTFYSEEFEETFHTKYGAKKEAEITYIQGCRLPAKVKQKQKLKILDICYGLSYNTAAALDFILATKPSCQVEIIALELDQQVPLQAIKFLNYYWSENIVNLLRELVDKKQVSQQNIKLHLIIEDARISIQQLVANKFQADAIFLDPFSPPKCPQLWTVEFLALVAQCLHPEGILASYSCSAAVRTALKMAGLHIGANFCVGRRSPGTLANKGQEVLPPLSPVEVEHLQTRAAVPFRDPHLTDTAEIIKRRREQEQCLSNLQSTSQWKKRWFGSQNFSN
jgi:tRNA U34 5-methylaminomethyl-2-thiouridine-forming methyltransferase MnmC